MLTLQDDQVFIVELAKRKPTRIKCEKNKRYKLSKGTMFDLGNNEINLVEVSTARRPEEEDEVSTLDNKPQLQFKCLAGVYKSRKFSIKVRYQEEERNFRF